MIHWYCWNANCLFALLCITCNLPQGLASRAYEIFISNRNMSRQVPADTLMIMDELASPERDHSHAGSSSEPAKPPTWAKCKGIMQEVYSAAWLTTADTVRSVPYLPERLDKPGTNMEGASFIIFAGASKIKTINMLDFYIEHLSWYERRMRLNAVHPVKLRDKLQRVMTMNIEMHTANLMKRARHHRPVRDGVAVMPFFSANSGVGHSDVDLRRVYLTATFWPLFNIFPRIVVSVCELSDVKYIKESGLPVYDILYTKLPSPQKLGVATLLRTGRALDHDLHEAGSQLRANLGWQDFKYVYYTESDQILHVRHLDYWISLVETHPKALIVPHRVVPIPLSRDFTDHMDHEIRGMQYQSLLYSELRRNSANSLVTMKESDDMHRCCFPTEDHACRNKPIANMRNVSEATFFQYGSKSTASTFAMIGGEGNFWKMKFRLCQFQGEDHPDYLPFCPL